MSLLSTLRDWLTTPAGAVGIHAARVPDDRCVPPGGAPLVADATYLRVWLSGMRLGDRFLGTADWAPLVHAAIKLRFGGSETELPHVAGRTTLPGFSTVPLHRVVQLDHPLTGLLPFRGGTIELAAGLVQVKQGDYLDQLVGVLGGLSALVAAPQVSAALTVAQTLGQGVQTFIQGADGELLLGVHRTFTGAGGSAHTTLSAGYYAVWSGDDVDAASLCVRDGRLCHGADVAHATPLDRGTWMLLHVEVRAGRDDWSALVDVDAPQRAWREAQMEGDADKAKKELYRAKKAVLDHADLTRDDASRICGALNARFKEDEAHFGLGLLSGPTPDAPLALPPPSPADRLRTDAELLADP